MKGESATEQQSDPQKQVDGVTGDEEEGYP